MSDAIVSRSERLIDAWIKSLAIEITPSERIRYAKLWLTEQTQSMRLTAQALLSRVQPILKDLERQAQEKDGPRLVTRVDSSQLVKSPESILEKMAREWTDTNGPPPVTFANFQEKLRDLGRFRIVTNFLSDARRVAEALAAPYNGSGGTLSPAQATLAGEFELVDKRFHDKILVPPGTRNSGARCHKGTFRPRSGEHAGRCIEVQVCTQLQEAWDKKDHFLSYERTRRSQPVPLDQSCEMFAMSELLYIADRTFDQLYTALAPTAPTTEAR